MKKMRSFRFLFCFFTILSLSVQAADNNDDIKLPDINLTDQALLAESLSGSYTSPEGLIYTKSTKKHGVKNRVLHVKAHNTLNPALLFPSGPDKKKFRKKMHENSTTTIFSNPDTNGFIHPDVVSLADQVYAQLKEY